MPLPNRVLPTGEIVALPMRGMFMGNRGCLHDSAHRIVKPWASKAWIICQLSFRGRTLPLMAPDRDTQLFFLDEATALAAGHRPCGLCRREALALFLNAWEAGVGWRSRRRGLPLVRDVDARLHDERIGADGRKPLFDARLEGLPDGAMVLDADGAPQLWRAGGLHRWTTLGYERRHGADPHLLVRVLTPRSTVAALAAGYRPALHPSAEGQRMTIAAH